MSKIEINEGVRTLADQLMEQISIDEKGVGTFGNKDAYKEFLTSNEIDVEVAEKILNHHNTFLTSVSLAHGESALQAMKNHKDVQQSTLTVPTLGRDSIVANFVRSREGFNPVTKEAITSYGQSSVKVDIYATGNRGMLADVKKHLRAQATEAFGK